MKQKIKPKVCFIHLTKPNVIYSRAKDCSCNFLCRSNLSQIALLNISDMKILKVTLQNITIVVRQQQFLFFFYINGYNDVLFTLTVCYKLESLPVCTLVQGRRSRGGWEAVAPPSFFKNIKTCKQKRIEESLQHPPFPATWKNVPPPLQ